MDADNRRRDKLQNIVDAIDAVTAEQRLRDIEPSPADGAEQTGDAIAERPDHGGADLQQRQESSREDIDPQQIRALTFAKLGLPQPAATTAGSFPGERETSLTAREHMAAHAHEQSLVDRVHAGAAQADRPAASGSDEAAAAERGHRWPAGSRLGSGQAAARRFPATRFAAIAAALLALTVAVGYWAAPGDVRAQMLKLLQFLPGFASVQTAEDNPVLYVLPQPVVREADRGQVEIRGISIAEKQSLIQMTGTSGRGPGAVVLLGENGARYSFRPGVRSWSSASWQASFYFDGPIAASPSMAVVLGDDGEPIPVFLQPTEAVGRIDELGATAEHNGIRLTAVSTPQDNGSVRVTLLPQLATGRRIHAYGFGPYDHMAKPRLEAAGSLIDYTQDETFPHHNELIYTGPTPTAVETAPIRLTVPELAVVEQLSRPVRVKVPVPAEGSLELNQRIEVAGYPVTLQRVTRDAGPTGEAPPGTIRIDIEMHLDENAPESLRYFFLDAQRTGDGGAYKMNEATYVLEQLWFKAPEGKSSVELYIEQAYFLVRGPWSFELTQP